MSVQSATDPPGDPSGVCSAFKSTLVEDDDYDVYDSFDWEAVESRASADTIKVLRKVFSRPDTTDPNSDWTQDDEDNLIALWRYHPLRKAIRERCQSLSDSSEEFLVWGHAIWNLGWLPTDVVSIKHGMIPEHNQNPAMKKVKRTVPHPNHPEELLWSPEFYSALYRLMTHPEMPYPDELRAWIQYTVISATDDRRPWNPGFNLRGCDVEYLERFFAQTSRNEDRRPLREIRLALRDAMTEELGGQIEDGLLAWADQYMSCIESLTTEERKANRKMKYTSRSSLPDDIPFVIRVSDLENLAAADDLSWGEREDVWTFKAGDAPFTRQMYQLILEAMWLDVLREQKRGRLPGMAIVFDSNGDAGKPGSKESTIVETVETIDNCSMSNHDNISRWLAGWYGGWQWWSDEDLKARDAIDQDGDIIME
ncbi:hypothetical protein VTJ04DRAFT_1876 [Mycothermus thermophilus]|uniref:uncharacterized protein n=1 Tax=Humicola insolens TaxID=85995 RepID=UPI0037424321